MRAAFAAFDLAFSPLVRHLNRQRQSFGLAPHRVIDDTMSPDARIAQLPSLLEPQDLAPDEFHLLGPLVDEAVREAIDKQVVDTSVAIPDDDRPVLYVGFGRGTNKCEGISNAVKFGGGEGQEGPDRRDRIDRPLWRPSGPVLLLHPSYPPALPPFPVPGPSCPSPPPDRQCAICDSHGSWGARRVE